MSAPPVTPVAGAAGGPARPRRRVTPELAVAVLAAVCILVMVWSYYGYYPAALGPAQPIAFSHRLHATDKEISCLVCHPGVVSTARAGVPPLETCMLCHSRVIVHHPEIEKLRAHYEQGDPVEWVRVNAVPDFVYFVHEVHVRRGFDCGRCHGEVSRMDRVAPVYDLKMGFCVQCHRDTGASHDCLTCHR